MKYEKFWKFQNSIRAVTINCEFSLPGLNDVVCNSIIHHATCSSVVMSHTSLQEVWLYIPVTIIA